MSEPTPERIEEIRARCSLLSTVTFAVGSPEFVMFTALRDVLAALDAEKAKRERAEATLRLFGEHPSGCPSSPYLVLLEVEAESKRLREALISVRAMVENIKGMSLGLAAAGIVGYTTVVVLATGALIRIVRALAGEPDAD